MGDRPSETPMENEAGIHQCSLCKKTFPREATRKRHYYYCRTRLADAGSSRRRSCATCIRAKTRCIRPSEGGSRACIRCVGRGTACDLSGTSDPTQPAEVSDETASGTVSIVAEQLVGAMALSRYHGHDEGFGTIGTGSAPLVSFDATGWNHRPLDLSPVLQYPVVDIDADIDLNIHCSEDVVLCQPATANHSEVQFSTWNYLTSYVPPFGRRTFPQAHQGPLAALAVQIICSYPSRLLRKATLPSFMSPVMFEWARSGNTPRLQPLVSCLSIIYFFSTCSESRRNSPWDVVRIEQEKILAKFKQFDRWELLASFQALLVYCILRIKNVSHDHSSLDAALLRTIDAVFEAIVASEGGIAKLKLPASLEISWADWIYNESLKRVILVFDLLNILVRLTADAYAYMTPCRHIMIPLTRNTGMWAALDLETWKSESKKVTEKNTIYAVSSEGELMKVKIDDTCLVTTTSRWEDWAAEVGEMGTLVMTVGALLKR